MVETVGDWVVEQWANRVWGHSLKAIGLLEQRKSRARDAEQAEFADRQIERHQNIIRWVKPYARKPHKGMAGVKKKFPMDLRGWKYIRDVARGIMPGVDLSNVPSDALAGFAKLLAKPLESVGFGHIEVMYLIGKSRPWQGVWRPSERKLEVAGKVPSTSGSMWDEQLVEDMVWRLRRTTRHELQHMAQDLLGLMTGAVQVWVSNDPKLLGREERSQVGLAPRRVRDPKWSNPDLFKGLPMGQGASPLEHGLMEREFVTDLTDSVDEFERMVQEVPVAERRRYLDKWLRGEAIGLGYGSKFFGLLRRRDPARWRAAVERFVGEIQRRGIQVQGVRGPLPRA